MVYILSQQGRGCGSASVVILCGDAYSLANLAMAGRRDFEVHSLDFTALYLEPISVCLHSHAVGVGDVVSCDSSRLLDAASQLLNWDSSFHSFVSVVFVQNMLLPSRRLGTSCSKLNFAFYCFYCKDIFHQESITLIMSAADIT